MDRMIAILGALLEENDIDTRRPAREFRIPGEYTDMEISRVGIYSAVCLPCTVFYNKFEIEMRV